MKVLHLNSANEGALMGCEKSPTWLVGRLSFYFFIHPPPPPPSPPPPPPLPSPPPPPSLSAECVNI
ncbi:hypothetical protein T06_8041 [Trichinella sp. T6]|nr:hypothetical protein T06_8041 [Trichinella sp. T6]